MTQTISDDIADQTGSGGDTAVTYATGGPVCVPGAGCGSYSQGGSWALAKNGAGTLVLSGTNTYSGGTNLNAGVLSVGSDASLGHASDALNFNGGTLQVTGNTFASTSRAINWGANGGGFDVADAGHTFEVTQDLTGTGDLNKSGAGTLLLSGSNSYRGATRVDAGTLRAGAVNAFSPDSTLVVRSGAVADLAGLDQTVGSLAGGPADAGNITLGPGTLTLSGGSGSQAFASYFFGSLSGTGGVTKNGGYGQYFYGINTYSGMTAINAGVFGAGAANALSAASAHVVASGATLSLNNHNQTIGSLAGAGNVTLGTAVLTAGGDNTSTTFSGSITGGSAGAFDTALLKTGSGVLTLSGTNTFTGRTVVEAGTLRAGAANAFSPNSTLIVGSGGVVDLAGYDQTVVALAGSATDTGNISLGTATLTLSGGNAAAYFYGSLSGTGGLIKEGISGQWLYGTNDYSGTTQINAGVLGSEVANTLSANSAHVVGAGGWLWLAGASQTIGSLAGAGAVTLGGVAVLTAGGDDSSTTFSGSMIGTGGFTKTGAGSFTLAGTQDYSGTTTAAGGIFELAGTLTASNTVVASGGTLTGTGTARDVTVQGGGALAPGALLFGGGGAVGIPMMVNGTLTFTGGGQYLVVATPDAATGVQVSGSVDLSGGTASAVFLPGSYMARNYTILSAVGGLGGTQFAGLNTTDLPAGFDAALAYIGNDVLLRLTAQLGAIDPGSLGQNQQNVAAALNGWFNGGGTLPPAFAGLFGLTGDRLNGALSQASGEARAAIPHATFLAMTQFLNMVFDPHAAGRAGFGGGAEGSGALGYAAEGNRSRAALEAYAAVTPRASMGSSMRFTQPRWSVWGGGYGGLANVRGDSAVGTAQTTSRAWGFALGADRRLTSDTVLGFALAGGGTSFGLAGGLGGGTSDLFQASLYGRQHFGAGYVMGALAYGWQDMQLKRVVTLAGNDTLESTFKAHTFAGRAEAGWRFGGAFSGVTPYGAVQVARLGLPAHGERATTGTNAFALAYASRTETQTRTELGARFDHTMALADAALTLRGRAAWAHDHGPARLAQASFQSLPGAAFTVNGARASADALLVSAGAELSFGHGVSVAGTFESEFAKSGQSYAGKGAIRYTW